MPQILKIAPEREWLSPKDVEHVYGMSRNTLLRVLADAAENGQPIESAVLRFRHNAGHTRKRPFVRIRKASLDAYLAAHFETITDL